MFSEVRSQLRETVQVEVESAALEPEIVDNENHRFYLTYRSNDRVERYPCTQKAWESWARQVLTPTGSKTWSPSAISRFLEFTRTDLANKVVKSWWEEHVPKEWHVVKYKNSADKLGEIRYIGSNRYQLYTNKDFLEDLGHAEFDNMSIKGQFVSEDYMLLRILDNEMLDIEGKKLFSGFHIVNSENGSASIVVKHLIFDLVCTNGLTHIVDQNERVRRQHNNFDRKVFRKNIVETAKKLPEFHERSKTFIKQLAGLTFTQRDAGIVLQDYKTASGVSNMFINEIGKKVGHTIAGWELISLITEQAQKYAWGTRMRLEEQAGLLAGRLPSWRRPDVVVN